MTIEFCKLILIGDAAVGKTSIRRRYFGQGFENSYMMTLGADFAVKHLSETTAVQIWDLAGVNTYQLVRKSYYIGAQGAILIFDVNRKDTLENAKSWIDEVYEMASSDIPLILVGNKIDLRKKLTPKLKPEQIQSHITKLGREYNREFPYFETSALTGENIDKVFEVFLQYIEEQKITHQEENDSLNPKNI